MKVSPGKAMNVSYSMKSSVGLQVCALQFRTKADCVRSEPGRLDVVFCECVEC